MDNGAVDGTAAVDDEVADAVDKAAAVDGTAAVDDEVADAVDEAVVVETAVDGAAVVKAMVVADSTRWIRLQWMGPRLRMMRLRMRWMGQWWKRLPLMGQRWRLGWLRTERIWLQWI